jgi:hypothetical protein
MSSDRLIGYIVAFELIVLGLLWLNARLSR